MKGEKKLFHVKIGILGTIRSSLRTIYLLVILKHPKNNSILMNIESDQQLNANLKYTLLLKTKTYEGQLK